MASCQTEECYGYEESRFERKVDENFHCSICFNVLKEPRMCGNNEHMFCLACITQYLNKNSETCPECNEILTEATLRRPRVVNNCLYNLKINCDYASRGCPEFTRLEELKTHVADCGFSPVLCTNVGCGMEVNSQDRLHHETAVCEYGKGKCQECGQTHEVVRTLKGSLLELDEKVEAAKEQMKKNHFEMKKVVERLEGTLMQLDGKVDAVNKRQDEIKTDVKQEVKEIKKEVKDVKEDLCKVNKDVEEVKCMISQILEKLNSTLELPNKLPPPTEGMLNTPREDILITGGLGSSSTEIYSWEKYDWLRVSPMQEEHGGASLFLDDDQLFAVGGTRSKTIEILNLNELPFKWTKFPGGLPYMCEDHQTVICQERVIHIGGYYYDTDERSNVISELQLTPLCRLKEVCRMPEPRECHCAEMFEDKILIFGGENRDDATLDSVLEFNAKTNKIRKMPPLPSSLTEMATVRWRDTVVVLGGCDKERNVLNDVVMYSCRTGKTTALPSMKEKRYGCCAAVTGSTIVVMGGKNGDDKFLKSMECFTIGHSTWHNLPAMKEARYRAVAEVLPSNRKYV